MAERMARRRNKFCLRSFVWEYFGKCLLDGLKKRCADIRRGDAPYRRDLKLGSSGSYPVVDSILSVFIFRLFMPEIYMFWSCGKCCAGNGSAVSLLLIEPILCFHYFFLLKKRIFKAIFVYLLVSVNWRF